MEQELIIEPGRSFKHYWGDLWRYRELFYILAWRDVAVRYKQTVIRIAWTVIRPFVTIIVFTIAFNKVADFKPRARCRIRCWLFAAVLPSQFSRLR